MLQMKQSTMPERLIASTILCELKRATLAYMEAAIEANTSDVKRVFERLAQDTVRKHEQLHAIMRQNQMMDAPRAADLQEIRSEVQKSREKVRSMRQWVNERVMRGGTQTQTQGQPQPTQHMQPMSQSGPQSGSQPMSLSGSQSISRSQPLSQQPSQNYSSPGVHSYNSYMQGQRLSQPVTGMAPPPSYGGSTSPEYALPHSSPFAAVQGIGHEPNAGATASIYAPQASQPQQPVETASLRSMESAGHSELSEQEEIQPPKRSSRGKESDKNTIDANSDEMTR